MATDMLSRFPDSILSHILSFLPTKYAVATSVLSRRWEFLWTQIHSLYLDDNMTSIIQTDDHDAGRRMTFPQVVERVMMFRDPSYSLEKFHLNCRCDANRSYTWVGSAIAAGVRELTLSFLTGETIQLPRRVFTSNRLVVLKLSGCRILLSSQRTCLPCLKSLHLFSVTYQNNAAVRELISSCSVLDTLVIRRTGPDNVTEFDISSHSLKCLTTYFYYCADNESGKRAVALKLDTPRLQVLKILGQKILSIAMLSEMPSLREAHLEAAAVYYNWWSSFLQSVNHLKVLSLSANYLLLFRRTLPSFCNLTHLKLEVKFCSWEQLQNIFDSADILEALTYHEKLSCGIPEHQQTMKWITKPRLSCLSSVSIIWFHGSPCSLEVVRYILRNAEVLNKMEIRCSSETSFEDKFELIQKILEMPRFCRSCNVKFS